MVTSSVGQRLRFRAVNEAGFLRLPAVDRGDADDKQGLRTKLEQVSYEVPAWEWRGIPCTGQAERPPTRFIDGTLHSRTVGIIEVGDGMRPLVLASIGAIELRLDGRALSRDPEGYRTDCVLCMAANEMDTELTLELAETVKSIGVRLVARESNVEIHDFEQIRRRAWDFTKGEMEDLERRLLLQDADTPTSRTVYSSVG